MSTYRQLFSIAEFRALFITQSLIMAAAVISGLAVGTVVYAQTASPVLTGLAMFGGPLVQLVSSRYLLAWSDLLAPRTALMLLGTAGVVADLVQWTTRVPWEARLALVASTYVAVSATGGAPWALLSDVVPKEAFVLGRATLNITVGGMQVIGNGVGAALLVFVGPRELFAVSAAAGLIAVIVARLTLTDRPARASGAGRARTKQVNRAFLASPTVRSTLLMMWVPNGLIVGCEALYIPYAGDHAGQLFAGTSAGMLLGDVIVGRLVSQARRGALIVPLRILLAAPFLILVLRPTPWIAAAFVTAAGIGYSAALPLQERLLDSIQPEVKGQAFGLVSTGITAGQALGALLAGALADAIGEPGHAMVIMSVASIGVTAILTPALRRPVRHSGVEIR